MPTDNLTVIRSFCDADTADLCDIMVEEQDAIRRFDPRMPAGISMVDAYFAQTMEACRENDGAIFVAELDARVVGFVTLLRRVPHPGADDIPGTYGAVMDLAVRDGWHGRGVGAALLRHAESEARTSGVTELRLHVLSKNQRALDLYQRVGFSPYAMTLAKLL